MQQSVSAVHSTVPPTSTALIREPWPNPFHLKQNVLKCLDTKSYLLEFLTFEVVKYCNVGKTTSYGCQMMEVI